MNILRWKRKSKKKIKFKTLILIIFSLIMTTFAWFAYSKVLRPTLNIHIASWDMEYYIGTDKKTNPISVGIPTLYPAMDEYVVTIDIFNNGDTLVDIEYQVQSITIAGTTYEIVPEGRTNTSDDYIALATSVSETVVTNNETTDETTEETEDETATETIEENTDETTDETTTETATKKIYKNVITNDITRFPFTIEIEHSAQVEEASEDSYGNIIPGEGYLKITVNWIGDNNELDSEWGYKVGEYFANNENATSAMSIVLSIDSYQADPDGETIVETLPSTSETKPYLPTGFSRVVGTNLDTGLVIKDTSGNEYVWVEVPKSASIYTNAGLSITTFSDDEYASIETDLKNYAADYTTREDEHSDYRAIGLNEADYLTYKKNMLKSIYQNGGFYIGRYETGIEGEYRTKATATNPTQTPVIKANVYPYNYITCYQAHALAIGMNSGDYTSSLMFGLQWDLTMKYLETKSISKGILENDSTSKEIFKTDSTSWGNYANTAFNLLNKNALYTTTNVWSAEPELPYEKESGTQLLIGSGGNSTFCKQNIYDLAGNLTEWTYNIIYKQDTDTYIGGNGGDYQVDGTNAATYCGTYDSTVGVRYVGFRVTIY